MSFLAHTWRTIAPPVPIPQQFQLVSTADGDDTVIRLQVPPLGVDTSVRIHTKEPTFATLLGIQGLFEREQIPLFVMAGAGFVPIPREFTLAATPTEGHVRLSLDAMVRKEPFHRETTIPLTAMKLRQLHHLLTWIQDLNHLKEEQRK